MTKEQKNIFNHKLANCYIDINGILQGKVKQEEVNKTLENVRNDLLFLYEEMGKMNCK